MFEVVEADSWSERSREIAAVHCLTAPSSLGLLEMEADITKPRVGSVSPLPADCASKELTLIVEVLPDAVDDVGEGIVVYHGHGPSVEPALEASSSCAGVGERW